MRHATCLLLLLLALGGCSRSSAPTGAAQTKDEMQRAAEREQSDNERPRASDRDDPCQLLTVAEVEAALGPLAVPPYRSTQNSDEPSARGDSCIYVARDDHNLNLSVSFTGGKAILGMFGAVTDAVHQATGGAAPQQGAGGGSVLHQSGASGGKATLHGGSLPVDFLPHDAAYAGEWDEVRVMGCCRLNTFLDDSAIVLDFSGSKLSPAQAVELVNKALLRLKTPITTIDGRAGVAAATQRLTARAKHPHACDLVPRATAEALLGVHLSRDPVGDDTGCEYRYRPTGNQDTGSDEVINIAVNWRFGFSEFREGGAIAHSAAQSLPGINGVENAANLGASMMAGIQEKMKQAGGGSFESLGKAVESMAGQAQGKKTATPEGGKAAPKAPDTFVGPWDDARWNYPDFVAVHRNIQIDVKAGLTPEIGQKFAAKAFAAIP